MEITYLKFNKTLTIRYTGMKIMYRKYLLKFGHQVERNGYYILQLFTIIWASGRQEWKKLQILQNSWHHVESNRQLILQTFQNFGHEVEINGNCIPQILQKFGHLVCAIFCRVDEEDVHMP